MFYQAGLGIRAAAHSSSIAIVAKAVAVCFSAPSIRQKHVSGNDCELAPGLYHPRAANQALARSRGQQVQFVLRGDHRLAARGRCCDRGRIVDQVTPP